MENIAVLTFDPKQKVHVACPRQIKCSIIIIPDLGTWSYPMFSDRQPNMCNKQQTKSDGYLVEWLFQLFRLSVGYYWDSLHHF